MNEQPYTIEQLDPQEWRCVCMYRCLLGMYTMMGGVLVKVTGKRSFNIFYIYEMLALPQRVSCPNCSHVIEIRKASLRAHCPGCHTWRELYVNEQGQVCERSYIGPLPYIRCKECDERAGLDVSATPDYNTA
jgi:hypothetical protein